MAAERLGANTPSPWGQPPYLYITDTQRKRDQVLRESEDAPLFSPESVTLSEFKGKKNVLLVSYPLDFTPT